MLVKNMVTRQTKRCIGRIRGLHFLLGGGLEFYPLERSRRVNVASSGLQLQLYDRKIIESGRTIRPPSTSLLSQKTLSPGLAYCLATSSFSSTPNPGLSVTVMCPF